MAIDPKHREHAKQVLRQVRQYIESRLALRRQPKAPALQGRNGHSRRLK